MVSWYTAMLMAQILKPSFFFFATSSSRWRSQFPDQGSNASRLHWKCGVLTTGLPRKPCSTFISNMFIQVNSCCLEHHLPAPQCSPYNIHCPSPSPRSLVFPSKTCPSTLASVCSSTGAWMLLKDFEYHSPLFKICSPWLRSKESPLWCRRHRRCGFNPWVGKIPWRRKWDRRVWWATVQKDRKELDTTKET